MKPPPRWVAQRYRPSRNGFASQFQFTLLVHPFNASVREPMTAAALTSPSLTSVTVAMERLLNFSFPFSILLVIGTDMCCMLYLTSLFPCCSGSGDGRVLFLGFSISFSGACPSGSSCLLGRFTGISSLATLEVWNRVHARRSLGGPGSHPPRCEGKCGRCTPCRPVRVTVPPGTPVTTEYYPEAWRCKCRNHLYMP
ncbi:hypothetical protein J5N97_013880 [Dioscorea zingiberensis]|uniref:Epidermal patterning factor-like protein n=1 Tax=Dioscorea zingiberensis TaxID=325984 RepID=A0A9D5HJ63_9LILI|nr:hypothetical protein J5N97_013880 [Dioscorea zingiberensis]